MRIVDQQWVFDPDDALRALIKAMPWAAERHTWKRKAQPLIAQVWRDAESLFRAFGVPLTRDLWSTTVEFEDARISSMIVRLAAVASTAASHWDGQSTYWKRDYEEAAFERRDAEIARLENLLFNERLALMTELLISARPELSGRTVTKAEAQAAGWKDVTANDF